ncbi:MAG: phytochrome sensor protein [Pseudonocardiales bacterium]|nr:phytochrome sensor protein [Pseudonocardiales bacterium]
MKVDPNAREADVAVTLQCGFYARIIGEVNLRGDPAADAVLLGRVHDAVLAGERCPVGPRTLISDSWRRSLAAHVDPDHDEPPVVYDHDTLEAIRSTHPLGEVLSLLRAILVSIADEAEHMMIVTDADGHILWREGKADVCLRADRVLLTEGTKWSESAIGTNAMGTALALGRPVQIHSAEHLVRTYHAWTCAAAPVADPDSGSVVGAIDVTGPQHTRHPATLALVTAAAQLAQGQLWARMTARDELLLRHNIAHLRGPGALLSASGRVIATESCGRLPPRVDITAPDRLVILPDGREATVEPLAAGFLLRMAGRQCTRTPTLSLAFLGATHPVAVLDGRTLPLSLRHAEILALLSLHRQGMSAEALAIALYGEAGNPVTARAEMHRLRAQLGDRVIRTRPYRLGGDVDADFLAVPRLLQAGRLAEALAAWRGPLLPRSDALGVREERDDLIVALRDAVLHRRDAAALWSFAQTETGADDIDVLETLATLLPPTDTRRSVVLARIRRGLA